MFQKYASITLQILMYSRIFRYSLVEGAVNEKRSSLYD